MLPTTLTAWFVFQFLSCIFVLGVGGIKPF
jgi:hypothetical protein